MRRIICLQRIHKSTSGYVLAITLVTLFVLAIIGVAFLNIGVSQNRFTQMQYQSALAFYYAQTGADVLSTYIVNNTDDLSAQDLQTKIDSLVNQTSSPYTFHDGTFTVKLLLNSASGDLRVESIGTYQGSTKTVSTTIHKHSLFENPICARGGLTLWSGAKVYGGDVFYGETYSAGNNAKIVNGVARKGKTDFPDNTFPAPTGAINWSLDNKDDFHIDVSATPKVNDSFLNKEYGSINIPGNSSLTINVGNTKQRIIATDMNVLGGLNIIGTGKLLLYVRRNLYFKGLVSSLPENLIVYVGDYNAKTNATGSNGYIELKTGNSIFKGYIIGTHATVDITSNLDYSGGIIAEDVTVTSNAIVRYDATKANGISSGDIDYPMPVYDMGVWSD